MKTAPKKLNLTLVAIAGIVIAFSFSSCQKNDLSGPAKKDALVTPEMLSKKTNGGRQATFSTPVIPYQNAPANSIVFKPNATMFGSSYPEWSGKFWKWLMELPPVANHPLNDDPGFDVTMGQTGDVWFLAGTFGTITRAITVPADKALFVGLLNGEASDLEGMGATYADRRATAIWQSDHIVPTSLSCTIDGQPINLGSYRFVSPEFSFTAPSPWYYGATGGNGHSVADGYFVMLKPLSAGTHTINYTGAFHFTLADDGFDWDASMDMTYTVTQL